MNKNGPARQFEGGSEVICNINNYHADLHSHSKHCQSTVDEIGFCNTTKHQLHCFTTTDEFESVYPRLFRREVRKMAKSQRLAHKSTAEVLER